MNHIIPKQSFIFDSINEDEFKECWALSNLRLITKKENALKGRTTDKLVLIQGGKFA